MSKSNKRRCVKNTPTRISKSVLEIEVTTVPTGLPSSYFRAHLVTQDESQSNIKTDGQSQSPSLSSFYSDDPSLSQESRYEKRITRAESIDTMKGMCIERDSIASVSRDNITDVSHVDIEEKLSVDANSGTASSSSDTRHDEYNRRRLYTLELNRKRKKYQSMTRYRCFHLQALAFEDHDELLKNYFKCDPATHGGNVSQSTLMSMEPRVFVCQTPLNGKRLFISTHMGRFMDQYWRECDVLHRHFYELIKEETPCRLFLDLEFNKSANPDINSSNIELLMDDLFEELSDQFELMYNIIITRPCLVDLDSSTDEKFSRHWIFHLPNGQLFNNISEVGSFMKIFVTRMQEDILNGKLASRGRHLLASYLLVNKGSTGGIMKLESFIDLSVYTRNRIFRLLGSTKYGKTRKATLRIAEANAFPFPIGFNNSLFYFPCGKRKCSSPNVIRKTYKEFCKSLIWDDFATAMAATFVVPPIEQTTDIPTLKVDNNQFSRKKQQHAIDSKKEYSKARRDLAISYRSSPLPKLETFVKEILGSREGTVGSIRAWRIDVEKSMIFYYMRDNRYCENINRSHTSNNIIWNCCLSSQSCWQSCYDPDCKGFRGKQITLSDDIKSEMFLVLNNLDNIHDD